MLNTRLNRNPATRSARVAATIGLLCITIPIVAIGAAQSFSTFSGSIVDPSGGGIPKATIVLTSPVRDAKYEVSSDQNGHFEFLGLPPGDYEFEAKYQGFMSLRGTVTVASGNVERKLALTIGRVTETVTVQFDRNRMSAPPPPPPRPGSGPAPRSLNACSPSATGGNVRPPKKLVHVAPIYPPQLVGTGVAGTVVLEAAIGADGSFRVLRTVTDPNPTLTSAAIEAVSQWEFDATLLNCVPVEVLATVNINFVPGGK